MIRLYTLVIVAFFGTHMVGNAQVTLGSSPYTQDFNNINAGLPSGWTVRTGATSSALGTTASFVTTATSWANTAGNFRNVAAAAGLTATSTSTDQNNSTNRALAVRQTGTLGDPGAAFTLQLSNTSGLSNFQLVFKLQSLDGTANGRTTTWRVDYGFGASPSSFATVTSSPATLTTTLAAGGISWGSTDVTVNFGNALDNNSSNVWIRIVTVTGSTGSGSRPTSAIDDVQISFSSVDNTAPAFTSGYPKSQNLTTTGFDLVSNISEAGKTYYVILPNNAAQPASAEVKSGNDAGGGSLPPGFFGTIINTSPNADFSATINSLNPATDYDVYVVAEDALSNVQASPVKLDVLTNSAGDVTAPVFTSGYPSFNNIQSNGFTLLSNLNEQGKTYFVVIAGGATAPSAAQVKNGQDANGNTLATNLAGSINVTAADTEFNSVVAGLTPNTSYDVYLVAEDNVPNLQAAPVKLSVTTGNLFVENFNACDATASLTSFSTTGAQVWGCTDFGRGNSKGIRMNGFSGTAQQNEDWLISPPVTLSANASLSFYSQFSFAGNVLQLKISTTYSGNGDPSAASWTDLNGNFPTVSVPSNSSSLADWTLSNVDLSSYSGQTVYVAFVYTSTTTAAARWTLDDISFNNGLARYLQVAPSGLLFTAGNSVKTYTVQGFNLTTDVAIAAPANFQVSKDNIAFQNSISFTAGEVTTPSNVYVRFNLAAPSTDTFTGNITHTATGISSKNVVVTGTDKSLTLDVVTWNLEWFSITSDQSGVGVGPGAGAAARTPAQVALQRANVANVIKSIDADIYCLQEVGNENANFDGLVSDLGAGWAGIRSLTPTVPSGSYGTDGDKVQRLAIIYKTSVVNPVVTRSMLATVNTAGLVNYPSSNDRFWASGRFPFLMTANVTVGNITKQIDFVDIHARANGGSTAADQKNRYDMRRYDVEYLKDSLDARMATRNIILLGDFNDDVKSTVVAAAGTTESSYKKYVDDNVNYNVLTMPLSQANAASFVGGTLSLLDHLITSNELTADYLPSSTSIEDARTFIANYVNTTSDHLPVTSRFVLVKSDQTIAFDPLPTKTFGDVPFALSATASSGLPVSFETSDASIASISGSTITILKAGQVTITARQSGNSSFNAANDVTQTLTINKANQQITFQSIGEKQLSDTPFTLSAAASSGLPVTFTVLTTDKATLNNAQVTIVAGGKVIITASQPGNTNFNPAPVVSQNFCVKPAKPTVSVTLASGIVTLTSSLSGGYKWFLNGTAIPGATNQSYTATLAGTYKVQVNLDDCLSDFSNDVPVVITGDLNSRKTLVSAFPNPTRDKLYLDGLAPDIKKCFVFDVLGRATEMNFEKLAEQHVLEVSSLADGVYVIRINNPIGVQQIRFVKTSN